MCLANVKIYLSKTDAHDNAIPYQCLCNIYMVLDVERPLRYI